MNYYIETATEDEWEDAMALAYRTFNKFEAPLYSPQGVDNFVNFISDHHLFRMFQIEEYHLWLAKDDTGKILGIGSLRSGNHVSLLFVEEKWQRCGIGSALMKEMEEFVKKQGKKSITVNSSPYGIPFYHSVGFSDTGSECESGGMLITPMEKYL